MTGLWCVVMEVVLVVEVDDQEWIEVKKLIAGENVCLCVDISMYVSERSSCFLVCVNMK